MWHRTHGTCSTVYMLLYYQTGNSKEEEEATQACCACSLPVLTSSGFLRAGRCLFNVQMPTRRGPPPAWAATTATTSLLP